MRILLLGEYSNVHATLADGLRTLGHHVTVASNGDFWKDYPRDIDLSREEGRCAGMRLAVKILFNLRHFTGFDIVQIINPMFLELKAERVAFVFDFLRRHNRKIVLGAFGMDYYWVHENMAYKPLRYSDFNIGDRLRADAVADAYISEWVGTNKEKLSRKCACEADAIVTGLYEYDVCYRHAFPDKTTFIPFPIKVKHLSAEQIVNMKKVPEKVRVFVGISKGRSEYKGTDVMLKAAQKVLRDNQDTMMLTVAEGVPFSRYTQMMLGSDIIMDQLYSYTPAMNSLEAMSQGIICMGGGEPENYDIIDEHELRPIINVTPDMASVCTALEQIIANRQNIPLLKQQSVEYITRHHDHVKVARRYESLYSNLLYTHG